MNTINVENCKTLLIGRRGENEVTTVAFDFTEWASEFGSGVVDLYVKRFGDNSAYPVVLTIDGTVASWLVTETDTNVAGYGKAEYVYRVDGKIAKSAVFPFFVAEDIGQPASEPPDPYESWLEQLTALGAETEAHAQAAEQSAENAADSAEDAAQSSTSAEGYAGQAETAAGLAQAAQTASEAARDAAQTAQASAEASATAASGSATSAAGSATAAAGSASSAGASATTASTAAGQAEAAKTAAQAAQTAAEDAAEDAQQAAQQAHVEYEQLSGEVDDLSDEVSQQKSALTKIEEDMDVIFPVNDPTVDYTLIRGSYVKTDGTIASYSSWTRTDYVPCSEGEQYQVHWDKLSNYNCFYNSSKGFLSSFSIAGHSAAHTAYETFTVPAGASYFILSNETAKMSDFDLKKVVSETYDYNDLVAEVENIRVGADGTVYDSAGEAVRTQIEELSEEINGHDDSGYGLSSDAFLYPDVLPSYYITPSTTPTSFAESKSYLDNKIAQIPKNGKSFIFVTDTHIDGNAGHSTELINYIRKRTGINTVLFGGDAFGNATNKYLAAKKLGTYTIPARRAFGYAFLPCVGDHDYNTVNVEDDESHFLPYSQVEELFVGDLERRSNYHYYDASAKLAQFADPTSDDYKEAMAFFKTVYYVDDNSQQIRFIVLNTGCGGDYGAMHNIFGTSGSTLLRLQADWFAETLRNTPNNYDVVVLSHKGNTSYVGTNATIINAIMYGAKRKASVYPHPSSAQLANIDSWWPNTTQYDFSDANTINRIIAINGHHHADRLAYFGRANGATDVTTTVTVESGSTIIQPDEQPSEINNCQIPLIVTSCDSIGVVDSSSPSMTAGTVTEQCFDVITLTDNAIVMTRIGAGEDRILYIDRNVT